MLNYRWNKNLKLPLNDVQTTILNNRLDIEEIDKFLKAEDEIDIQDITDSLKAAEIVKKHIDAGNKIMIVTDYDADGVLSCSILYYTLKYFFHLDSDQLITVLNLREYSNGVNDRLTEKIIKHIGDEKYGLLITADHGSADDVRYKELNNYFKDIVVTDHHTIPESGILKNVSVFVNPQKDDNEYMKKLSGATVALSVMLNLLDLSETPVNEDFIKHLHVYAGISVLTDQMDLRLNVNRNLVTLAVEEIKSNKHNLYRVINSLVNEQLDYGNLSFVIGALINASSRQGDPYVAFKWLTIDSNSLSYSQLLKLQAMNNQRKREQNELIESVFKEGRIINMDNCIFIPIDKGHSVNGIIAGVIGDRYKKPTMVAAKTGKLYYGSARGIIKGFSIKELLSKLNDLGLLISFGGHEAAAGFKFEEKKLPDIIKALEDIDKTLEIDRSANIKPDIEFNSFSQIDLYFIDSQESLAPYGNSFKKPVLTIEAKLEFAKVVYNTEHSVIKIRDKDGNKRELFFMNGKQLINDNRDKLMNEYHKYYFSVSPGGFNGAVMSFKLENIDL